MQDHLKNTWRWMLMTTLVAACAPNTQRAELQPGSGLPKLHFNKVLVVYVGRDPRFRQMMEDELARQIPRSVPAYSVNPRVDLPDAKRAKARMQDAGFDGVVLARLKAVGKKRPYEPGVLTLVLVSNSRIWSDWSHRWSAARDPQDFGDDDVVRMVTDVYLVADGEQVWTNRSNRYDPSAVPTSAGEIVAATVDHLKRDYVFASLTGEPAAGETAQR